MRDTTRESLPSSGASPPPRGAGSPDPVLELRDVHKAFLDEAGGTRAVLSGVSLRIRPGRRAAIVGRSGSGKSTLLHLAAGLEVPDRGTVRLAGRDLGEVSERDRTLLRRRHVGLVFQFFHLLPTLSVRDNVALPHWIAGGSAASSRDRVADLLERVGLADRARQNVQTLSGGEMQRVAICRALLAKPTVLLADEPTGNLDDENSTVVMDQLFRLATDEGSALVYVTHSDEIAAAADERWFLHGGVLEPR